MERKPVLHNMKALKNSWIYHLTLLYVISFDKHEFNKRQNSSRIWDFEGFYPYCAIYGMSVSCEC